MKKLLERREVIKELSSERKQEIDEGVKLASKVDSLRRTLGKEEVALKKFRAESVGVLNAEISELTLKRNALKTELESLNAERERLVKPLDTEWLRVKEHERQLQMAEETIEQKQFELMNIEKDFLEREKAIREEKSKLDESSKIISAQFDEAQKMLFDAKEAVLDAKTKAEKARLYCEGSIKAIEERRGHILSWEREFEIRREHQDKRELELNRRETLVNDRYQTLLRTEQRLKK